MEMFEKVVLGNFLLILSIVSLGFLVYTLVNLDRLEITITHPRVIVELILFLVFLIIGVLLRFKQ